MRNTVRRAYVIYALIIAFFFGIAFMMYSYATQGRTWVTSRVNGHLYTNRQLTTAGSVYDRNGKLLVGTDGGERVFNSSRSIRKSTLHAVGDTEGYIATGVQTLYRSYLIGYDFINGVYKTVRDGTGNDITLTLDADICKLAYDALGTNKGTVGVYNYKTGELLCMTSTPTYDPENKPSSIETDTTGKYDGVYINRFLSGVFTPGSTFKVVTAISALENISDITEKTFTCTGKYETGEGEVICSGVHGKVNFKQALNKSCNCAFAQIAEELGKKKLTATAKELGYNTKITACGMELAVSTFNVDKASKADLGWAGIGQYTTLTNPCNMMMIAGMIANGGQAVTPKIIKSTTSQELSARVGGNSSMSSIKIDPETAQKMKELLRSNVKDNYSDSKLGKGLEMCGKTGTAENGSGKPHAWFMGFSQKSSLPYAIVVTVENGGWSSSAAVPIVKKVMTAINEKYG